MRFGSFLVKVTWFYVGLAITAVGYALVIRAGVGAAPWDIFHLGIVGWTNLPLGLAVQLTGVAVILLNLTLRISPSLGMLLNMLSVGPMLQVLMPVLPIPAGLAAQSAMLLAGILLAGIGTALYASADLGAGPRDGMMIGLTRKLGIPVALIKNSIDLIVTLGGWILGGPLGLGTLVVALGLGPSVQLGVQLVTFLSKRPAFAGFVHPIPLKQN